MELFPKWNGIVDLPPLPERRIKIGDNVIVQRVFPGARVRAKIFAGAIRGHDHLILDLAPPFNELLLKHPNTRHDETSLPVLLSDEITDPNAIPEEFKLKWKSYGILENYCANPGDVVSSWNNKFHFKVEDDVVGTPGLRSPQMGALHAIAAHFSVGSEFEPATVVLPTGTGKTETMLAAQVYLRLSKTLVIVPSDALRSQISKKFITLGMLPLADLVPPEIARPRVAILTSGITSEDEAKQIIEQANVIVALPNTFASSSPAATAIITQGCSDLVVDEAHHITAPTWQQVRSFFDKKRILQFTATPFRRDGKRIDGKIIFNYRLGDAQDAGYYRSIKLSTVEEYGEQDARDRAIAAEAIRLLRRDRNDLQLDHILMARTNEKKRADEIVKIYQELAPEYKPQVVYSGTGRSRPNKKALEAILDRGPDGARIIVCVDMLGEGYDLPNLKIAAFHDNHKSLAIALQFIGRFTRKGNNLEIGEASAVVNIADPDANERLRELYAEGADWDKIIKRLSEDKVDKELRLQEVVLALKKAGTLHTQLSLWNLKPPLSAQFYRTQCTAWNPEAYKEVLPQNSETWFSYSEEEHVLVAVVCRNTRVDWGSYENVLDTIYDLLIIRWDKANSLLCMYASDAGGIRAEKIATAVTNDDTALISGDVIFNALNNVDLPLVKNLGSSRIGAISFTAYFGPNVTDGLADIEKSESNLSNIACIGFEKGERVLWGCASRRGKIWQHHSTPISEWISWTQSTWDKINMAAPDASNITKDFLRPTKLDRPYKEYPISVQWGEHAQTRFNDKQFLLFDSTEAALYTVEPAISTVNADGTIDISITNGYLISHYRFTIDASISGGYKYDHISGPKVKFKRGRDYEEDLADYLRNDPFIIRYADGTYSYNCYHIPTNLLANPFERTKLESLDWTGVNLRDESMGKNIDVNTIQYRTYLAVKDEHDLIFNDDGSGEAGDLVCLKETEPGVIKLTLVHCKGAHKGVVSGRIDNFYFVCGQAQKSVVTKHLGLPMLYNDLKNREDRWRKEGKTRFLKGDIKLLSLFKEKARRSRLDFELLIVQPGCSPSKITNDILQLLGTTELYVNKTTQGRLRVIMSADTAKALP